MARQERVMLSQRISPQTSNRGIVSVGILVADYYTAEPSPDKWIAVGTVMFWPDHRGEGVPRWMLVGQGRNEQNAVANLRLLMSESVPPRWKAKCNQSPSRSAHVSDIVVRETENQYVVPWEIVTDDFDAVAQTVMSELAASQATQ